MVLHNDISSLLCGVSHIPLLTMPSNDRHQLDITSTARFLHDTAIALDPSLRRQDEQSRRYDGHREHRRSRPIHIIQIPPSNLVTPSPLNYLDAAPNR